MLDHKRGKSGASVVEELERRRLFATRVFFQDFDDPADDWLTGTDRFSVIPDPGTGSLARRKVVSAEDGAVPFAPAGR